MYRAARRALFLLPPETAHAATFAALRLLGPAIRLCASRWTRPDPRLATQLGSLTLPGPVGLAAGLDKDGVLADVWPALGFGFVELGTVTPEAQPGNPLPRLFRVPEQEAIVNRMGFNNGGADGLATRLKALSKRPVPIGVNVGRNKTTPNERAVDDYQKATRAVASVADYLVVNVSSPNTPGLRQLQDSEGLRAVVQASVQAAAERPVFVKLAPDLSEAALEAAVAISEEAGAVGFVATNTTIARPGIPELGPGGLSGAPLHTRALAAVKVIRRATRRPIIGVGGVRSPATAIAMLAAGADVLQIYTGFIYEGPGLVRRLNGALLRAMDATGAADFASFVARLREEAA